jgi:hypothetical protein
MFVVKMLSTASANEPKTFGHFFLLQAQYLRIVALRWLI